MERTPVRGGDVVPVGALEVKVLETPGHTLHHQSFVVWHGIEQSALFSGGSLLHGTVGRTDLVDPLLARLLGRAQWQSARHQAVLPSATTLHPTHGFGSFCSSVSSGAEDAASTVGHERHTNSVLTTPREAFVGDLVDGFGPIPTYYRRLARLNRAGAGSEPLATPSLAGLAEVADRARRHEWVLDVRPRASYAAAHLPGSVSVEMGDSFATYAGWVTPWGTDLTVVGDDPADLDRAVRDLGQIGVTVGRLHQLPPVREWPRVATIRRVGWEELAQAGPGDLVLDVRHAHEHAAGHLPEARHLPLPDLWRQAAALPAGRIWVHCQAGFRAATAAGLLARLGRDVVLVDDDWARAASVGLTTDRAA